MESDCKFGNGGDCDDGGGMLPFCWPCGGCCCWPFIMVVFFVIAAIVLSITARVLETIVASEVPKRRDEARWS